MIVCSLDRRILGIDAGFGSAHRGPFVPAPCGTRQRRRPHPVGFFEHRLRFVGGERGFQIDPAAVDAAGETPRLLHVCPQGNDVRLQLRGKLGALLGVAVEDLGEFVDLTSFAAV